MRLSQSIVDFIGHLLPLYIQEQVDGVWGARSLVDGTLILPIDELEDEQSGWVKVQWQGDPVRVSEVQGVFIASVAVARYVELHHTATHNKETQSAMAHLSDHFMVKTGESLDFEAPVSGLLPLIGKAVTKVGETTVIEILKKAAGL